jgi:hypothetical protein
MPILSRLPALRRRLGRLVLSVAVVLVPVLGWADADRTLQTPWLEGSLIVLVVVFVAKIHNDFFAIVSHTFVVTDDFTSAFYTAVL